MYLASEQEPVFIVGCPRSGTTFLQALLSSHSRLIIPPEDDFILRLRSRLCDYRDTRLDAPQIERLLDDLYDPQQYFSNWDLPRPQLQQQLATREQWTPLEFVEAVHDAFLQRHPGKSRWGCKVPYFALHLAELSAIFPKAKFIHLIRDGRDTFVSMRERTQRGATHFPRTAARAAWVWKKTVVAARRQGEQITPNYTQTRYEDLVTDPHATLRRLCEFLQEPFSEQMVTGYYEDLQRHQHRRMADMDKYVKQKVDPSNTQRWQSELSATDRYQYEAIAGRTLLEFGYPVASQTPRVPLRTRAQTTAHRAAYWTWDHLPEQIKQLRYRLRRR